MRALFLCHAHPDLQAGGTEIFARDLFRELCRDGAMRGLFVGGATAAYRAPSPGTALQGMPGASDEMLLWTGGFDPFLLSQVDLHRVVPALTALLEDVQPEIVHIHHLLALGSEVPALVRRVLPRSVIVITLHDYYGICAHDGQMVTVAGALCDAAGLDACRRCFPERGLADFRLRQLNVESAFAAADLLVAPSRFLRERFIAWGVAPERIRVLANGVPATAAAPHRAGAADRADQFGFFGHLNRFKGAAVAVQASARLSRAGVAHGLAVHGGDAHQAPETLEALRTAFAAAPEARRCGAYARGDLGRLMAGVDWVVVPSVWWENAPLVIQEAQLHRRPVICSGIGGMAEMVRDGVDGLHVPPNDPAALAAAMCRAAEEPGLWRRLVDGIGPPVGIAAAAAAHRALYDELLRARRAAHASRLRDVA